ncbi:DUF2520 domain-containing protein [Anaerotruncus sp. 80]|uniref:DUF2520 domain-containing protein n=1 Tax=Anaerotruncus colihominis TaxID=169435 RepID=A0A845QI35_9FIRM|nr:MULTISPECIES: Rossmann-like and DUF2520 domain-containing protein [Anaerotruncus]NBH60347.1 DUF2520 domain-containing protein [Anaerotruncus colihominis]NCF01001.1 DUF2520 domain-containing protein [Anaerotruncus sp. 80]
MRAGFIGAGKVGFSLGKYLAEGGISLSGYYSRSPASAKDAAAFTGSRYYETLADIVNDSDTLFITVPDGCISEIWDDMRSLPIEDKNICHCSGSIPSTVFFNAEDRGAFRYSIHPLYAISSKYESYKELPKAYFAIEGSPARLDEMRQCFEALGNKVGIISPEVKTLYHAAAVMVSNQMIALADIGAQLLQQCGFEQEDAEKALAPLILGNAQAVTSFGAEKALTGPCERGDDKTVAAHIKALEAAESLGEEILRAYRTLSVRLVKIAGRKNPSRDYRKLKKELEQ